MHKTKFSEIGLSSKDPKRSGSLAYIYQFMDIFLLHIDLSLYEPVFVSLEINVKLTLVLFYWPKCQISSGLSGPVFIIQFPVHITVNSLITEKP